MFNNQIFESWLTKMSDDILSKVNREKITTEEMIILILKAQTNHFHHMDEDLNKNISDSRAENQRGLDELRIETKKSIDETQKSINDLREEFREDFHRLDQKLDSRFMWSTGITITLSLGLYLKLFLG